MRVNVYAEEMTDRVELVSKVIDGQEFTGVRFYLYLPVTVARPAGEGGVDGEDLRQVSGPFIHREGDDDSAAVTFWGKRNLRDLLHKALSALDRHYDERS